MVICFLYLDAALYPTVVLAQESNQTRMNENTFQNNTDINQSSGEKCYQNELCSTYGIGRKVLTTIFHVENGTTI